MKNFLSLIFLTLSFLTYSQNVAPTVADATATVTEGGGIDVNLSISDDDGDSWTISIVSAPSVGTTEINPGDQISYTHDGSEGTEVTFTYRATDSENNESSIATVTITVTGVNDAPTSTGGTISTNEDENYTLTVNDFNFSDPDDSGSLNIVKITTLETNGNLEYYNGTAWVAVTQNQEITASDITSGYLRFRPDANENGSSYTSFAFQVSHYMLRNNISKRLCYHLELNRVQLFHIFF